MPWSRLARLRITLVDRSERFAFLPLLHEAITGCAEGWEVARPFTVLLADSSVRFAHASVENVYLMLDVFYCGPAAPGGKSGQVSFDRVVVALGAECGGIERVLGAVEHALPFCTWTDAVSYHTC